MASLLKSAISATGFRIATLPVETGGRIGVCPMPGCYNVLETDLATTLEWAPAVVVSMTEKDEMETAGSAGLEAALTKVGVQWAHFPIRDYGGPNHANVAEWPGLSATLHTCLDRGEGVLLHCKGGQGRSGMIALRLLVERGEDPNAALLRLRTARPGAVETQEQMSWGQGPLDLWPSAS